MRRLARFEVLENRHLLSVAPTLAPIADAVVYTGAPLYVALDAHDADGQELSFSATGMSPVLTSTVLEGNRSMRVSVQGFGDMEFELFEQRVPNTTGRIIELAQSGFYDGLTFHRVVGDFIQGGDPNGDGTGGSGVTFDDEFHRDVQYTSAGLLGMTEGANDENDSQFFVTAGPTRDFDFTYSAFGFQTAGEQVRRNIEQVNTIPPWTPDPPVVIDSVEIFADRENGVLMLLAPMGTAGEGDITVTVSDTDGQTSEQTFHVTIQPDLNDNDPFLLPIPDVHTTVDTPTTFTLGALDIEGDAMLFDGLVFPANANLAIESSISDGVTTVTPTGGLVGVHGIFVGVQSSSGGDWDTQAVPVFIHPAAPTVELMPASDTGTSNTDLVTRLNNTAGNTLDFRVSGVIDGAEVTVLAGGVPIGQAIAGADSVVVATDGIGGLADGVHSITAVQTLLDVPLDVGNRHETVDLASEASAPVEITVDTIGPEFLSTPPWLGSQGEPYFYDAQTDDEAGGFVVYRLANSPTGMIIDQSLGGLIWFPQPVQGPVVPVVIEAEDLAGNAAQQAYSVVVGELPPTDFLELPDQPVSDGDHLAFQTFRGGRLTVEALFSHAVGDVDLTLLDGQGAVVGTSATLADRERIDLTVAAGQSYQLVFAGGNPEVTVRLANLLVESGSDATIFGTAADDTFEAASGSPNILTVNRVQYESNHATVQLSGGGGNDTLNLYDSAGDDQFVAWPNGATMITPNGTCSADGFETIVATAASGGADTAEFYDSAGDDLFVTAPSYGLLEGDGFSLQAVSFHSVNAYAPNGGHDVTRIYDSPGDDIFYATPVETTLSRSGDASLNRATYFEEVHGFSTAGGYDIAILFDSAGDDTFYAGPAEGAMRGLTGGGPQGDQQYFNRVKQFEEIRGDAAEGGNDLASLFDSQGSDTLVATPTHATISGEGFVAEATDFPRIEAHATPRDNPGVYDRANLYDSAGDDEFITTPAYGALQGNGFYNQAIGFSGVNAYASTGNDTATMHDGPANDTFYATPSEGMIWGPGYYHRAENFDRIDAFATAGGDDEARLFDSAGDDTFYGSPVESALYGTGYYNRVEYFEKVYADASSAGSDQADLPGSDQVDLLEAAGNWARLSSTSLNFLCEVLAFDRVDASATTGDTKDVTEPLDFVLGLQGPWQDL